MTLNPQDHTDLVAYVERCAHRAVIAALAIALTPDAREVFMHHLRFCREQAVSRASEMSLETGATFEALFDIAVDALAGPPAAPG